MRHNLRGDWTPSRLTRGGLNILMWGLACSALSRAGYYADKANDPNPTGGLSAIESAFPLTVWITLYALGGLSLAAGLLLRRWQPAVFGNGALGFTYAATGIAYFFQAILSDNANLSPMSAMLFLLPGLLHLLYWQRNVAALTNQTEG